MSYTSPDSDQLDFQSEAYTAPASDSVAFSFESGATTDSEVQEDYDAYSVP